MKEKELEREREICIKRQWERDIKNQKREIKENKRERERDVWNKSKCEKEKSNIIRERCMKNGEN